MHVTAAASIYGELGFGYDPLVEAAEYGVVIQHDPDALDVGEYDESSRTIRLRHFSRAYYRSTATYQLARVVLHRPSITDAVLFACARLIDDDDLRALAAATSDRRIWARTLHIRQSLLAAYMQIRSGLPVTA